MTMNTQSKRLSRTTPMDNPKIMSADAATDCFMYNPEQQQQQQDDNISAVHEYKNVMEDINNEHPGLSTGAMQQMALERCAKLKAEREGQSHHKTKKPIFPPISFRGMMSNLRIGRQTSEGSVDIGSTVASSASATALAMIEDIASSTRSSSTNNHHNGDPNNPPRLVGRRSLAARKSVCSSINSADLRTARFSLGNDSESECHSLQDSLEDIERSYNVNGSNIGIGNGISNSNIRRGKRNASYKSDRRLSNLSMDLSDVEEETAGNNGTVDKSVKRLGDSSNSLRNRSRRRDLQQFELSVSDILPDEIKLVFDNMLHQQRGDDDKEVHVESYTPVNFGDNNDIDNKNKKVEQNWTRRKSRPSIDIDVLHASGISSKKSDEGNNSSGNHSSFMSSILSTDFEGDFSAWSSFRGKSKE